MDVGANWGFAAVCRKNVEALTLVPREREQQRTVKQSVDVPRLREETVEALTLVPREVHQRTTEQHEHQFCEETIEVLKQILRKRGQQRTVDQMRGAFGRSRRGVEVGPTSTSASTDRRGLVVLQFLDL